MPYPKWIETHLADDNTLNQEGIDWIRSRPPEVKAVMRRFPLECVVRVIVPACVCLESGDICVVTGYRERHENNNEAVLLLVVKEDHVIHTVLPDNAELLACYSGVSVERVAEILEGV